MAIIAIMDSGVGGLSVYKEIRKVLPDEHYIYFSDSAYCPYGEKTPEFIIERCREITHMMMERGAEIMVIACNTATAAAIKTLRKEFDIPFIGMEPAIKPAALETKSGVVGVLATAGTLKASKYQQTKDMFTDGVKIVENVGRGFVELVESGKFDGSEVEKTVEKSLTPLLDAGADTIVLGCTHYPFLLEVMQKIAGPDVRFIDPAPAVAKHLVETMISEKISLEDNNPGFEMINSKIFANNG